MTDGGKIARRSARIFADDFHPAHEKTFCGTSITIIRTREDKQSDMESISTRSSSCASLPTRKFEGEILDKTLKHEAEKDANKTLSPTKFLKEKAEGRPLNFGLVSPGIYRSAYPQTEDYEHLRTLRLKTIVTLVEGDFPKGYRAFIQSNGIKHVVINMLGTKKARIPLEIMNSVMEVILDQRNHPVLVHCNHGKHRTGCVMAVLRIVMGWQVESIVQEYTSYAHPKLRETDISYIQGFKLESLGAVPRTLGSGSNSRGALLRVVSRAKMTKMIIAATFVLGVWAIMVMKIHV